MNRSMTLTTLMLAMGLTLGTGCVSQGEFDRVVSINRTLEERNTVLQQKLAERDQTIAELNAAVTGMDNQAATVVALRARLAEEQATIAALRGEISGLQQELATLGQAVPDVVIVEGLPQEVSDALSDLAAANPDLMTYDAARGMIRMRSDLTFGLGSATVNDAAKTALGRLAGVLNGNAASGFDIQVIGHTDAVPVKSAKGKQLFIDNRGLSSNRGDAVARVLIANRVAASRITSGGRGATQPIAANDARGRSQANRRVEIFLVKAADPAPAIEPAPTRSSDTVAPAPATGGVTEGEPEAADDSFFK